ncbi:hypothetical protein L915_10744, partial [Phytophthora nicotianae]
NNPAWSDIEVMVMGKDFSEIEVLSEALPEARVILCHFHVIDYLKREISKKIYGFTSFEKTQAKNLVTLMMRATDEREFDRYLQTLQTLSKDKPQFYEYLESNWLSCKDMWCTFMRGNIPHLDKYEQPIRG